MKEKVVGAAAPPVVAARLLLLLLLAFTKVLSRRRVSRTLYKHVCCDCMQCGRPILNPWRHASAPHPRPPPTHRRRRRAITKEHIALLPPAPTLRNIINSTAITVLFRIGISPVDSSFVSFSQHSKLSHSSQRGCKLNSHLNSH